LPAARGFLFRAGRLSEARSEFNAAAALTRNVQERAFLLARAEACDCKP
jgi:predicted RNA polymerase sigma factor